MTRTTPMRWMTGSAPRGIRAMAPVLAVVAATGLLAGCGGDGDDPVTTREAPAATAPAAPSGATSADPAAVPGGDEITEEGRRKLESFYAESFGLTPAEARCAVDELIADQAAGLPLDVESAIEECRGG